MHSFAVAFRGLAEAWAKERNFRVQIAYAAVALGLLLWLKPEVSQSLVVVLGLFGLLSAELMNTAVERVVDLVVGDFHPLARSAKDIAAGAVLVFAIGTAVVNLIVFAPLLPVCTSLAYLGFSLGALALGWCERAAQ